MAQWEEDPLPLYPVPPTLFPPPTSDLAPSGTMAKQSHGRKAGTLFGKGKVTPVQIAFIVDRYLTDNNYTNTLSAFHAEADHLFSKTKGKEVPRGLLGLADILDEYISLKEQRLVVDQEKRRVEMALHGLQEVMRTYHSPVTPIAPQPHSPPLLPSQFTSATTVAPRFSPSSLINASPSPSGQAIRETTPINQRQQSILPCRFSEPDNHAAPMPKYPNKRKFSKSPVEVPRAPKKSCNQLRRDTIAVTDKTAHTQVLPRIQNTEKVSAALPTSNTSQIIKAPISGPSVVKSLFKQLPQSQPNSSSPKTPPLAFPSQSDKSASSPEGSCFRTTDVEASREITSANCSIFSSETFTISPLKGKGYISVERNYRVTSSSPFKSSPGKPGERETSAKGRLHFDEPNLLVSTENPVATSSPSSSTDAGTPEAFDFDFLDLDFMDGDLTLTEFLVSLDCEGTLASEPASAPDFLPGLEHDAGSGCLATDEASGCSTMSTVTRVHSEDMSIQGHSSLTSVRTITKCIKVLSPAKARSNSSLQP